MSPLFSLSSLFVFIGILFSTWQYFIYVRRSKLPPGPIPLPIIGSIHLLGNLPHRALYKLSQKYGDIMSIRLGNVETIVLSSPDAAKLFLGSNDAVFASRPQLDASKYFSYGNKGLAFKEYGSHWRSVRKLCTMELLSATKVKGYATMRKEEIASTMEEIKACCTKNEVVNLSEIVASLIENMTFKMLFGGNDGYEKIDYRRIIRETSELVGAFNLADYVPMLAPLDLQGLTRRIKSLSKECDEMLETLINDHEQDTHMRFIKPDHMDFTDIMLSLMKTKYSSTPNDLSHVIDRLSMKAILLDLIVGAADASITAIEWVLSALIKHPRVMKKLQQELKDVVGDKELVDEIDLTKLSYLHMVVKETFRLYPTAPLLVPRESIKDVEINGYQIPKMTRVVVNFWAFGRDAKVWSENYNEFFPERFLDKVIDLRGLDFELIPFGTGRRGCPGINLGLVNVELVVAQMVHSFNWHLPNDMNPIDLDMNEKFGLSMPRAKPLLAIPS